AVSYALIHAADDGCCCLPWVEIVFRGLRKIPAEKFKKSSKVGEIRRARLSGLCFLFRLRGPIMIKRAVALGVLAVILPGCAHDSEWLHRQPAVESTIGTDPNKVPAGKVYGPAGMGVDLSDRSPSGEDERWA